MESTNGRQAPSQGPDFKQAFNEAQASGDFSFVIQTAKDSHRMLLDFRGAILGSDFKGADARAIAMGLQFMDNMISQAASQLDQLKRTEKVTREAIKAAQKNQKLDVVGPEETADPVPEAPGEVSPPTTTPEAPTEPPAPPVTLDAEGGWEVPPNA